jgi:proline iminopeptidase
MKLKLSSFLLSVILIFLLGSCKTKDSKPKEGYIEVTGGKVWYRIYGGGDKTPILALHGGPGASSYSLEPLKALSHDRPVIIYDQLGCGRSTRITDTTLMTMEHLVEEVEQVRKALHLENIYLFGHSCGSTLGMDYYLKYPKAVKAIIFGSPFLSTNLWIKDADTLVATLPDSIQANIRKNEKNKTFETKEYQNAVELYYSKFLRRKERSQAQKDSAKMLFATNVYDFMWGPSEFTVTGNLINYDRVKNLHEITVPTLFITGEYDEARPATVKYLQSLVPHSELVVIKNSGHVMLNDNPKETIDALNQFLLKVDSSTFK